MERGPLALFGAIVAVGLGPAMWLGAQFGHTASQPGRPPAVTVQQNNGVGGVGGAAPDDPTEVPPSKPTSNVEPWVKATPKPRKSSAEPSPSPSASPSEPEPTSSPSPSEEQSTPPTEPTGDPSGDDPSPDAGGDGTGAPPSPPPGSDDASSNDLSAAV